MVEREAGGDPRDEAQFGRVLTAMITPFDEHERVHYDAAQDLALHLVTEGGNDGLILAGTTGESPAMSTEATMQLVRVVREAVGNDVVLVVGTGDMITSKAVHKTQAAAEAGDADGFLLVNSPYNRPDPEGVEHYFQMVNDAANGVNPDFKGIVYNIPGRTGTYIDLETMRRIAGGMEAFVALKDAAPGPDGRTHEDVMHILSRTDSAFEAFDVYSGDDARNRELYVAGAVGAISVYGHWAGNELVAMFDAIDDGDEERASYISGVLAPSARYESMPWARNPIPARAMMRHLGFEVGHGVSPMVQTKPASIEALAHDAELVYANLQAEYDAVRRGEV